MTANSIAAEFGGVDALGNALGVEVSLGQQPPVVAGKAGVAAPAKADAIKNKTLVSGLVDALNKYQAEISGEGKDKPQLYPDRYNIVLVDDVLQNAKVVPPGSVNLKQTPMTQAQTANQSKNPATQQVNNNAKTTKILAGTSIVQFLDQLVRSSTYIYDQQIAIYDPKTGKLIENGKGAETVGWYRIGLEAVPQTDKFDTKRNDWAYDITYSVNIYSVSDVKSDFFPPPQFRGTHKKYYYWFTGENTQVLDFTQDYNYLYYIVSNGPRSSRTTTSNFREIEKRYYQVNSPESSQGQDDDKVNEPAANAADYLYSPGDQGRARLKIVGDPAWIFQGETWSGIQGLKFNYGPFLSDGTINYEGQEILFELAWNNPVDYDLDTGIADPTTKNYNRSATSAGQPQQSFAYQAVECVSHFRGGRFEQDLSGVLKIYPIPKPEKISRPTQTANAVSSTAATKSPAARTPAKTTAKAAKFQDNNVGSSELDFLSEPVTYDNTLPATPPNPNVVTGYSDPEAALVDGASAPRPAPAATPPTSGGQTVGTTTGSSSVQTSGQVATGTAQGRPVEVQVRTTSGATINATNKGQISDLYQQDKISRAEYLQKSRQLETKQALANAPVQATPNQTMNRES